MANPPLPQDASPVEILQQTIRKTYNQRVKDWFQDVDIVDELDLNLPRHAAYAACRHLDEDSMIQTVARQLLFTELRDRLTNGDIGETTKSGTVIRRGHPQIFLFFKEDLADVEPGYEPVKGNIGFRLMNENIGVSKAQLTTYATRIKARFNGAVEQIWRKGKVMACYADWEKGYQLQLLCRDKTDAKGLIEKILDIQNHSPDWENLTINENDAPSTAYPTLPPTDLILGETRRLPRRRPIADVRFQWAIARIGSAGVSQVLVDRSGRFSDTLVDW